MDEQARGSGDFALGSKVWTGTSKLIEEMGELQQVIGKLIATAGDTKHWEGSDLRQRLIEEMGDVGAALEFFRHRNFSREEWALIERREQKKYAQFVEWNNKPERP